MSTLDDISVKRSDGICIAAIYNQNLHNAHHTDPTLTIRNISQALVEVTDYRGLGIQLGLPLHELNTIEANHQRVERRKMEVLALWLQGPDPEWKDLIVALQLISLRRSVRKLQEAIQKGEYQGIWSKRVIVQL